MSDTMTQYPETILTPNKVVAHDGHHAGTIHDCRIKSTSGAG